MSWEENLKEMTEGEVEEQGRAKKNPAAFAHPHSTPGVCLERRTRPPARCPARSSFSLREMGPRAVQPPCALVAFRRGIGHIPA